MSYCIISLRHGFLTWISASLVIPNNTVCKNCWFMYMKQHMNFLMKQTRFEVVKWYKQNHCMGLSSFNSDGYSSSVTIVWWWPTTPYLPHIWTRSAQHVGVTGISFPAAQWWTGPSCQGANRAYLCKTTSRVSAHQKCFGKVMLACFSGVDTGLFGVLFSPSLSISSKFSPRNDLTQYFQNYPPFQDTGQRVKNRSKAHHYFNPDHWNIQTWKTDFPSLNQHTICWCLLSKILTERKSI